MSVYVGIGVHRKRSQVAVIDQDGGVLANRNVPNGAETILGVIGGLPPGTPAASGAAFGWGWLVELLEDYGFDPHLVHPLQCKAIASARLKNDKAGAAILAQLLRADLLPEAWIAPPAVRQLRALLRHRAQLVRLRTLLRNRIHAVLAGHGRPGCWSGPGRGWLASLDLPAVSREGDRGRPGPDRRPAGADRPARPGGAPAGQVRPAGQGPDPAARRRPVHRPGHLGRDRRRHPVRLGPQARRLGRAHPHRPRPGPHRPPRPHLQAGLGLAAVGPCARQRRPPSAHRNSRPPTPRSPAGQGRRSPLPRSPASCSPAPGTCSPAPGTTLAIKPLPQHPHPPAGMQSPAGRGRQAPGEPAKPHEPALPRSMT